MFAYTIGSTLTSEIARRTLVQSTDTIIESNIDPFLLATKAYSLEIISDNVYKIVIDKRTGDTSADRIALILNHLKDRVTHNSSILKSFLNILNDLTHQDLADTIVQKYKGMLYRRLYYMY